MWFNRFRNLIKQGGIFVKKFLFVFTLLTLFGAAGHVAAEGNGNNNGGAVIQELPSVH
jgi:hypothetical protein